MNKATKLDHRVTILLVKKGGVLVVAVVVSCWKGTGEGGGHSNLHGIGYRPRRLFTKIQGYVSTIIIIF